jgi:hypothetical protein
MTVQNDTQCWKRGENIKRIAGRQLESSHSDFPYSHSSDFGRLQPGPNLYSKNNDLRIEYSNNQQVLTLNNCQSSDYFSVIHDALTYPANLAGLLGAKVCKTCQVSE